MPEKLTPPRWWQLLFYPRARLQREWCAKDVHTFLRWWWRERVQFMPAQPTQIAPPVMRGWHAECVVCRTAHRFDGSTPRPSRWRKSRRYDGGG
jgi:hypothetical protein